MAATMAVASLAAAGCSASHGVRGNPAVSPAGPSSFEQMLEQVCAEYGVPALAAAFVQG